MFRIIYEQAICPKNMWQDRQPMQHAECADALTPRRIDLMRDAGIWKS